ncbi:MAG: hypothetical protein WKF30_05845 [Pyrinomonadaceae bacterium]
MIVLDEQLLKPQVAQDIARWYWGRISNIVDLRPDTQILDDALPSLLQTVTNPTFVTINYDDFWEVRDPFGIGLTSVLRPDLLAGVPLNEASLRLLASYLCGAFRLN